MKVKENKIKEKKRREIKIQSTSSDLDNTLVFSSNLLDSSIRISSYHSLVTLSLFHWIKIDLRILMIVAVFRRSYSILLSFSGA